MRWRVGIGQDPQLKRDRDLDLGRVGFVVGRDGRLHQIEHRNNPIPVLAPIPVRVKV